MMLNTSSALTPGLRTRSGTSYRNNNNFPMDENFISVHRGVKDVKTLSESTITKTPGSKKTFSSNNGGRTRRAFGDISNQDSSRSNHSNNNGFSKKSSSKPMKVSKSVSFKPTQKPHTQSSKLSTTKRSTTSVSSTFKSPHHLTQKSFLQIPPNTQTKTPKNSSFSMYPSSASIVKPKPIRVNKPSFSIPSMKSSSQSQSLSTQRNKTKQPIEKQKHTMPQTPQVQVEKRTIPIMNQTPVEDIELPAGRMWHEEPEHNSPPSFTLDGCLDIDPYMRIHEAKMREAKTNKRAQEKYQLDLDAGLKQDEADFNMALDMMDEIFVHDGDDEDFLSKETSEENSVDYGWMKEQMIFELDDLSI